MRIISSAHNYDKAPNLKGTGFLLNSNLYYNMLASCAHYDKINILAYLPYIRKKLL